MNLVEHKYIQMLRKKRSNTSSLWGKTIDCKHPQGGPAGAGLPVAAYGEPTEHVSDLGGGGLRSAGGGV